MSRKIRDWEKLVWIKVRPLEWFKKNAWKSPKGDYYRSERVFNNMKLHGRDTSAKFDDNIDYTKEYGFKVDEITSPKKVYPISESTYNSHVWGCDIINIEDYPEYRI